VESDPRSQTPGVRLGESDPADADTIDAVAPADTLRDLLARAFPDAGELEVEDRTGGGDHFQVTVASPRFAGLSLVEQHRLVYAALADPLADGTIHELRITTRGVA
jgi:stress-induced morphogen